MLLVDTAEPEEIVNLLKQSVPVTKIPLNQTQRSDYYFGGEDGTSSQFGRVQAGELLSNIDSMEDELRRYYNQADKNYQIIEGIISPVAITKTYKKIEAVSIRRGAHPTNLFSYKVTDAGFIYDEHAWNVSSSMLFAWLRGLERVGIITYYTINWVDTARLLAAIYNNDQKPSEEHTTLQRIIRPRITIKEQNPFVKALMSISLVYQLSIGEDRATKIAEHYDSLLDIAMASVDELCMRGIGRKTAEKLLSAMGRKEFKQ